MKLISKSLITIFATALLSQALNAKTTICYKKDWKSPATIETTKLDGGDCNGKYSYKEMLSKAWFLKDIKIEKGKKEGLTYSYILSDKKPISINNSKFMDNEYKKLDYKTVMTKLSNINEETATIGIGNLRVGQSAIVVHKYSNNKSIIVANAYVTSSSNLTSQVQLTSFLDIKQNAIPTSNRKPANGDLVILNYLYDASLIIAPSQDAFTATRKKYIDNNFLHSDLFAAKLKVEGEPLPSKETIQDFAISQNIGTIFFIIGSRIYIVDTKTFAILEKDTISYNFTENEKMPFYTRVDKIEENPLDSILDYRGWLSYLDAFLGEDKRDEEEILLEDEIKAAKITVSGEVYENYYKTLLGIN